MPASTRAVIHDSRLPAGVDRHKAHSYASDVIARRASAEGRLPNTKSTAQQGTRRVFAPNPTTVGRLGNSLVMASSLGSPTRQIERVR